MVPAPDKRGDNFLRSGAITSSLDVGRLIVDAVGLYPMRGDEYDELLGAYALHSTELSEREAVQAHLAECPRCRAEVKLHHEMAALLCSAGSQAPPGLWGRIVRAISEHPPGPTLRPAATAWPGDAPASTARWSEAEGPLDADPGTSVAVRPVRSVRPVWPVHPGPPMAPARSCIGYEPSGVDCWPVGSRTAAICAGVAGTGRPLDCRRRHESSRSGS